jgi:hypothetical protein
MMQGERQFDENRKEMPGASGGRRNTPGDRVAATKKATRVAKQT